ncbi:sensor histidine kinase [Nocardiopsis sp. FIRDI 009]|uniref:sensor histidine kinase n=1 Tax=Nocardiopsis sp. FIRDI 009 TaxID=714197 RepID=UPI000E24DA6D|nr:histidine kinase [Nocardiopsis sp. FIRDI 009]
MNAATPPEPRRRRSARDWAVDLAMFLLAVGFGLMVIADPGQSPHGPIGPDARRDLPLWLAVTEQLVAFAGCAALWWRRSRPVGIAVVLVVLSGVSALIAGAMLIALFSLAVHRPPKVSLSVFGLAVGASFLHSALWPDPFVPLFVDFLLGVAILGTVTGWGLTVHHRRKLVESLRDRAVHAEAEARLRAEQAQHQVREAIAREIHDVLGHRLSMLSVHAGALEYRPDASSEEVARSASVIRESAHQALQDLREVIGVLRAPVGELPQPTLADLEQLVEEADHVGARVELVRDHEGTVPERVGRTVYRVVQEALTNVRKHAAGADTLVRVAGAPGEGLTVEVRNGPASAPRPPGPVDGAGQGLVGLAERLSLASGRLEYGPTDGGGWRLSAWLPWPA